MSGEWQKEFGKQIEMKVLNQRQLQLVTHYSPLATVGIALTNVRSSASTIYGLSRTSS